MEFKNMKKKAKKGIELAAAGAKAFAKVLAYGYCLGAAIVMTRLAIISARTDSHLEWHPNK